MGQKMRAMIFENSRISCVLVGVNLGENLQKLGAAFMKVFRTHHKSFAEFSLVWQ